MSGERSVLITGCSSGIGLGLANAFHARGWCVSAALRRPESFPLDLVGLRTFALDLDNEAQILNVAARFDRLDCLVNNAGYALTGPFVGYVPAQMRRQIQTNLIGPALLTQALLPALIRAQGRIINLSSIAGEAGMPMNSLYCASKFGIEGLTESLRHELADVNVQVALVAPGGFRTRFAANMEWGARAAEPGSIEAEQLVAYRAMQAHMLESEGRDPAQVVDVIIRLAEMTRMPLRTRVGGDARALRFLQRCLPESLFLKIIGAIFRRKMAAGIQS